MAKVTTPIDELMEQAVARSVFPAAALLAGRPGKICHQGYYGKARKGMCFDIASLTKPIAAAGLAMVLLQEKKLKLKDTVAQWLPAAKQGAHRQMTIEHLLSHTAGFPAWRPFFRDLPLEGIGTAKGKEHILRCCLEEPIFNPPGKICEYSDLGYILLGEILERAGGKPLDTLFYEKIAKPLGLNNTFFVREGRPSHGSPVPKRRFAPTEDCAWRGRVIHGEVHDQNAYAMGGVAGHAGLFATSSDLHRFVEALLACYREKSDWIAPKIVKEFIDWRQGPPDRFVTGGSYVLGWDTPSFGISSAGRYFSPHTIGHLGYTGCSLWIDLEKDFWVILLTNRIHPTTANEKIKTFRPRLYNAVWQGVKSCV